MIYPGVAHGSCGQLVPGHHKVRNLRLEWRIHFGNFRKHEEDSGNKIQSHCVEVAFDRVIVES